MTSAGRPAHTRRLVLGLPQRLLAVGVLGILLLVVVIDSAVAGLGRVHRSYQAVDRISQAQRFQQDADMQHDALHADVYNALLVGGGSRPERAAGVLRELDGHLALFRRDLAEVWAIRLDGRAQRALRWVRPALENYAEAANRMSQLALRNPAEARTQLPAFEAAFDELAGAQRSVTSLLAGIATRTRADAQRDESAARRRIALASTAALVGLVGLCLALRRMGRNLAALVARERGVAETLQRSLLPQWLPTVPGVELATRYLAGGEGVEVGGDWYDAFVLPTGEVGLVIGDVVGHDVAAAGTMGRLRSALRAYAAEGRPPADVLTRVDALIHRFGNGEMATCVYAIFHPEAGTLLVANAGHHPPLVAGRRGSGTYLADTSSGPPLGAVPDTQYDEQLYHLAPGSRLLLFTDGLIERRGARLESGLDLLQRRFSEGPANLDELCQRILDQFSCDHTPVDDVALLAMRVLPGLGPELEVTVPALAAELAPLRHTLARWLDEAGASPEESYELTVACCEAAANAIEHAYGPRPESFTVTATTMEDDVQITVRDSGRWRPRRGLDRGRGLEIIEAFTDLVEVRRTAAGTEVEMRRTLASPLAGLSTAETYDR